MNNPFRRFAGLLRPAAGEVPPRMHKRRRAIALGAIALTLIAAILGHEAHLLLANVRTLDPNTCTGDWEGARSLAEEDEEGRAIASEAGQKIFCTFPSPTDKPVPLTRAVVSFTFEDYRETDPAPGEATTEEPEPEAEGMAEDESDAGTGTDEEAPAPEVLGETAPEEPDEEQVPEPAADEPAPEPDAEPAPEEAESVPTQESEASPEGDAPHDASEAGGDAPSEASARAFLRFSWLSFARVAHAEESEAPAEESSADMSGTEEEAADAQAEDAEPSTGQEADDEPAPADETPEEQGATDEAAAEEPPDEEPPAENEAEPEGDEDEEVPAEEDGEVLGDSTEPGEDDEAPVLTLSYTTTGARWTDLTTFSPLGNEVTFDIDLDSTADLEKLVVRLTADEIRGEPIVLTGVEVRIYTEAPLEELAALLMPGELEGFPHLYTKEFVIDPKARHACVIEPTLINADASPSLAFVARLYEDKDDAKAAAEDGGSGEEVAEQPAGEAGPVAAAPEDAADELLPPEDAPPEEAPAEAGTDALPEEAPLPEEALASSEPLPAEPSQDDAVADEQPKSSQEPAGDEGLLAGAITASEAVIDAVGDAVADLAEGGLGGPAALLEIGSLPRGIDIRFLETSGYALEFKDRAPAEVPLTLSIADPALAQRGSFSIPLIFTMRDGKDSITVCQMQVRNLPGHE